MSLVSFYWHHFPHSWLIWICHLFLRWPTLVAVQAISRVNNIGLFKKGNSCRNLASNVRLGSYDGAWHTEHNGTKFVTTSQILMEWAQFIIHQDNIWQTLTLDRISRWISVPQWLYVRTTSRRFNVVGSCKNFDWETWKFYWRASGGIDHAFVPISWDDSRQSKYLPAMTFPRLEIDMQTILAYCEGRMKPDCYMPGSVYSSPREINSATCSSYYPSSQLKQPESETPRHQSVQSKTIWMQYILRTAYMFELSCTSCVVLDLA